MLTKTCGQVRWVAKIIPGIPYGTNGSVVNYNHVDGDTSSINVIQSSRFTRKMKKPSG
jgi:hypothetical protein